MYADLLSTNLVAYALVYHRDQFFFRVFHLILDGRTKLPNSFVAEQFCGRTSSRKKTEQFNSFMARCYRQHNW